MIDGQSYRVLVVEDEYMLADELKMELEEAGMTVLGPVGTLDAAVKAIRSGEMIDGAVLDVNLRGEMAFPAADLLIDRGVPFVFTTGYDRSAIPKRFAHVIRCEKPIDVAAIARAMKQRLAS